MAGMISPREPDFFRLITRNWFAPELATPHFRTVAQAMRRARFLAWLGIPGPDHFLRESDGATWNGQFMPFCPSLVGMFAHEIGHWLVAAPSRRALPDFGMGELSNDPDVLFGLPRDRCLEEHCAVLMGATVCDALGIPDVITGAVNFTGWESVGRDQYCRDAYHWLGYHGLIGTGDYRLTGKRRDWEDGA